ncbi:MAG: hypothetical protein GVY36_01885 [Verrucomicrobia bacterium]|jgi:hypothetical protein|nr:hypothetical protein [Verrucomicrobiota bacterium]
MSTLSFHTDPELEKRIRARAVKRGMPLSSFLKECVERSLDRSELKGGDVCGIVSGKSQLKPEDTALPPWNESDPLLR